MCKRQRPMGTVWSSVIACPRPGRRLAALLVVVLAGLVGARPAAAQVFEALGERALGMGGAFVAVADDGTATYWNPAGLALGATVDACLSHASGEALLPAGGGRDAAATGSDATSFCVAFPAFGFSYNHLRATDGGGSNSPTGSAAGSRQDLRLRGVGVSSLVTRQVGVTLVQSLLPGIAVGVTAKYVRGVAGTGEAPAGTSPAGLLDAAADLPGRGSSTFDVDAGVMASTGPVRVGLTVRNARNPEFATPEGDVLRLQRQVRVGVALTPGHEALLHASEDSLIVALDVDLTRTTTASGPRRMVAAGAERWFGGHRLGLRAGVRGNTTGAARVAGTVGASVGLKAGIFVEAHGARGGDGADRGWGVGIRVGF